MCVGADRVARNDHDLAGQRVGDLVYDALQRGKPQREDDGIGALHCVTVVGGDDRGASDYCGQRSCRPSVGARELKDFAARSELAGDDRSDPRRCR